MKVKMLTSHATQCLSLNPMAEAPAETIEVQKALTQLKGRIILHLIKMSSKSYQQFKQSLSFIAFQGKL